MNGVNFSEQEFLSKITKIIEANLHNEQFGVNKLARAMGMSRITLHRKLTLAAGVSVSHFLSQLRLKKAFELLKQNPSTIAEVAFQCGFNSVTYFTKCFHDFYGFPPGEAKNHDTPAKPENEIPEFQPTKKKRWIQIAFAVSIALIATIISSEVFFFRPFIKEKESAENTIAIMPFVNDSGEEFAPFTTWMGIEIGNKLGKIENMLVVPQSTTETYRESKKSNRDIARELMVNHILRGRTLKSGEKILVNIELLEAKTGNPIFTEIYERNLDETGESGLNRVFEICEEVVYKIADVLQTGLTSVEKELVTKKPTENMAALRAYQEANHHIELAELNSMSNMLLYNEENKKAKKLLEEAVSHDTTFADAFSMLGYIYISRLYWSADIYLADRYLDTGKIYLDKALCFDNNNLISLCWLRQYYLLKGEVNEADKLLPYLENSVKSYHYYLGKLSEFTYTNDCYQIIESFFNYMEIKPADMPVYNFMLDGAFLNYFKMGFPERAREICYEMWMSKPNTVPNTFLYLHRIAEIENRYGNRDSTLRMFYDIHEKYPWWNIGHLYYGVQFYNNKGEYTKALGILQKLEKKVSLVPDSTTPIFYLNGNTGFTYLKNGMKEKADYHFKVSIKRLEDEIKLNSNNARTYNSHFNLAIIYSILNDKQKVLHYLEMIKQSQSASFHFIDELKTNPMFDNVRNEPEFQKIANELEKKYLEEHEKIKKLLILKGLEPA
jgi:TolB-like protein/AraC-like DNA-binding protein/tetratricopeptide (TPR) repeat protein